MRYHFFLPFVLLGSGSGLFPSHFSTVFLVQKLEAGSGRLAPPANATHPEGSSQFKNNYFTEM